jgi:hypothetical protein
VSVTLLLLFQRLRVGTIPDFSSFTSDVLRRIIKNGHFHFCLAYRILFFQYFAIVLRLVPICSSSILSVYSGKFIILSFAACSPFRLTYLLYFSNIFDFLGEYITHLFSWDIKHCAVYFIFRNVFWMLFISLSFHSFRDSGLCSKRNVNDRRHISLRSKSGSDTRDVWH